MLAFVIEEKLASLAERPDASLYNTVKELIATYAYQYDVHRIEVRNDGSSEEVYKKIVSCFDDDMKRLQDEGIQFTFHAARAINKQENLDQAILAVLQKDITLAQHLRIPLIVTHASFSVCSPEGKEYYSIMHLLPQLAEMGQRADVKIAIENISLKNDALQKTNDHLYILEEIKKNESEWLGITIDFGHAISCGYDVDYLTRVITIVKEKLFHIHAHETTYGADERNAIEGMIDWRPILKALKDIDYNGAFLLEVRAPRIVKSLDYLKSIDSVL